jgi:hypothetical protein
MKFMLMLRMVLNGEEAQQAVYIRFLYHFNSLLNQKAQINQFNLHLKLSKNLQMQQNPLRILNLSFLGTNIPKCKNKINFKIHLFNKFCQFLYSPH